MKLVRYNFIGEDFTDRKEWLDACANLSKQFGKLGSTSYIRWDSDGRDGSALFKLRLDEGYVSVDCAFTQTKSDSQDRYCISVNIGSIIDYDNLELMPVPEKDLEELLLNAGLKPIE